MALHGKSFIGACEDACAVINENLIRFSAVDGIGYIFVHFGIRNIIIFNFIFKILL